MAILVMCSNPECGELFDVPDAAGGTMVACPQCGRPQSIPSGSESAPEEDELRIEDEAPAYEPPSRLSPESDDVSEIGLADEDAYIPKPAPKPAAPQTPFAEASELFIEPEGDTSPLSQRHVVEANDSLDFGSEDTDNTGHADDEEDVNDISFSDTFTDIAANIPDDEDEQRAESLDTALHSVVIVIGGLVGIVGGMVTGIACSAGPAMDIVLAAYYGAIIGWVVGFVFGFLVAVSIEKDRRGKQPCYLCGNVLEPDAEYCTWCGSDMAGQATTPLLVYYLKSWWYAWSAVRGVAWLGFVSGFWMLLVFGGYAFIESKPDLQDTFWPAWYGCTGIIAILLFSSWLEFLRTSVWISLQRGQKPPKPPSMLRPGNLGSGLRGFFALCATILPIFTLPLIPLGILSLVSGKDRNLNLRGSITAIKRNVKGFAVLWLVVLLWLACMAFCMATSTTIKTVIQHQLGIEHTATELGATMAVALLRAVNGGFMVFVALLFILAVTRAVGVFGRHNMSSLYTTKDLTHQ